MPALPPGATHSSPVGAGSLASIQSSAIRPGASTACSAVAVAHVHPPSRLTRSPSNVVANSVPPGVITYFGSNSPP